uniref:Uncharacterized protein n=1 Tax=Brassica oleracea TaxID=3712 RepID=A0A3P6DJL8_BRAOL|nr:unnamed protein product [Brassica oleracea]
MRLLITGQAIDGYSEQDDEIIFLGLCRFLLQILCGVSDAKIKQNSGIVPMSRQVNASGLENQHGELPENELFSGFKTLKSSQTSKRGLGCFR